MKRQLHMGHPEIRLLYLTPETLFSPRYGTYIAKAYEQRQIRRLVIDEAHVIGVSALGRSFRVKHSLTSYSGMGNDLSVQVSGSRRFQEEISRHPYHGKPVAIVRDGLTDHDRL
jgi:hypothetical protein